MDKSYIISIRINLFFVQSAENAFEAKKNAEKLAMMRKIR
jgi:hypothetical protein